MMDEPADVNADVYPHPCTAMDASAGFLTRGAAPGQNARF